MDQKFKGFNNVYAEVFFQILLHFVLFLFFSFDKNNPTIQGHQVAFFINYAIGAFIINYVLLPRFYYFKKYISFFIFLILIITAIILVEEFVLERIFFPDTRGKYFPGVIFSLLDVMPIITILTGFKFAWDAAGKQREVDELRASVKESELQFLKSQINPHFLFNNLNNLYSYAIDNSPKTPSIILELSSVLRYMLYDCKEKYVPLSKETEHLQNFTKLHELQIEDRGSVTFKTENTSSGYVIAPLILSVFLENAFKYSTASQSEDISIDITLKITEQGLLKFECINSFRATKNINDLSQGIGLQNVKKRLEILYSEAYDLSIKETDTLYSVRLELQLKKETK